ncbi:MAG: glycosyltransferase family 2 protein [Planctomycetota bacterium]|nr:glycosyltransferase family 2 protein [Planctomycetota bacterium]
MSVATRPLLSLVIPTYNEAENIRTLVQRLQRALADVPHELIVVDDDSPDGTWRIAEEVAAQNPDLRVLRRTDERGLSSAVIAGFSAARGSVLGVIDGDLQHDERVLPQMVQAAADAELVVATRFAPGGGTGDWSRLRRLQSRIAAEVAHLILNVRLSDPMSGFFLVRREVFERVAPKLRGTGYKILLEMYWHASPERVVEVPFVFRKREHGQSKLGFGVVVSYLYMLVRLRASQPIPQGLVRFGIVGLLGAVVNTLVLWLLVRGGVVLPLASALAVQVAILHNFILNDLWAFRSRRGGTTRVRRLGRFELSALLGLGVNVALVTVLHGSLAWNLFLANAAGIGAGTASNFVLSKLYAWRDTGPEQVPRALPTEQLPPP